MTNEKKYNFFVSTVVPAMNEEGNIEAIDDSKECSICQTPISTSWECNLCKEVIVGECKECHYTNSHIEDAVP